MSELAHIWLLFFTFTQSNLSGENNLSQNSTSLLRRLDSDLEGTLIELRTSSVRGHSYVPSSLLLLTRE